jgi:hypothetical protein
VVLADLLLRTLGYEVLVSGYRGEASRYTASQFIQRQKRFQATTHFSAIVVRVKVVGCLQHPSQYNKEIPNINCMCYSSSVKSNTNSKQIFSEHVHSNHATTIIMMYSRAGEECFVNSDNFERRRVFHGEWIRRVLNSANLQYHTQHIVMKETEGVCTVKPTKAVFLKTAMTKLLGFGPRNALWLRDLLGPCIRSQYCDRTICFPSHTHNISVS